MQSYKTLEDLSRILSLFNDFEVDELSITQISKALRMTPSKVSRMVGTFGEDGFFKKNLETGKYRLGIRFFELGLICAFHFPLRKIIRPHIEQMAKENKVTASWGILRDSKVITIDRIQNLNIDLLAYRITLNIPIHSTSIGKILLAYLSEEEQVRILRSVVLTKFTNATIVDENLIIEHLKVIRERGYAVDEGETQEDLNCIAAPIKSGNGDTVAGIDLICEKSQMSAEKLFQLVDYLKQKALFISRQLGY